MALSARWVRRSEAAALSRLRIVVESFIALLGAGLVALAIVANQSWLDRHILPSFYLMRTWYVSLESTTRLLMIVVGAVLIVVARPRLGRLAEKDPASIVRVIGAAALAIVAGALVLRWTHPSGQWLVDSVEPLRQP